MSKHVPRYRERDALIPVLAADLARQLKGYEADPSLVDAVRKAQSLYKKGFAPITLEQFENTIRLIATGASIKCGRRQIIVRGSGIAPPILCRYLANPDLRSRFDAARLHWRTYRGWGMLDVEELLDELAHGDRSLQSICYARGFDRAKYDRLLNLIARAPEIEAKYHRAKRAQFMQTSERLFEEVSEISTRKEARELYRRMHIARIRMPKKIRATFKPERTPIARARLAAGLRQNGKPRGQQAEEK